MRRLLLVEETEEKVDAYLPNELQSPIVHMLRFDGQHTHIPFCTDLSQKNVASKLFDDRHTGH